MNNKIVVNTFTEGMNKDADKSLISSKSYTDAHNFRMITTKGNSTGSLETIKGNKLIASDILIDSGQFIIGSCEIRDNIVLFTTNNTSATPTAGVSMIWLLQVDIENETQTTLTKIYDDSINQDNSYLLFSVANPIKAVSRYETPNVQKVYWTDGFNNIRYANIGTDLTISGEVYEVGVNPYMGVDKFEFLPKFVVTKPTLVNVVGGNIKTGVVAYSYQLYRNHGSPTAFSPVSQPIHVTSDSNFLSNTLNYNGDKEPITSGKGFIIGIDSTSNIGYDRLRLVRIEYPSLNSLPKIIIANEIAIDPFGTIVNITDTGDVLGELTIDEFNITSTELFKCQDIAIKDNILFAANIEKSDFTIGDWDARAVRFNAAQSAIVNDTVLGDTTLTSAFGSNWTTNYTEDHDGINHFNNPTYDGNATYQYMYQSNGSTLGAEGPNIKIDFSVTNMVLDDSADPTTFYVGKHATGTDKSYLNYASPWKGNNLSWQRDEIYRLFVVFGNDRGQTVDPKWICDLRMPSLHDADFNNSDSVTISPSWLSYYHVLTGKTDTNILFPRIYFKSFPTGATWAQIYRVKRERKDRSVLTQALVLPTYYDGVDTYRPTIELDTTLLTTNGAEIIKLVSPEINITRNITKQASDYLQYVTSFSTASMVVRTSDLSTNPNKIVFKFLTNTRHSYLADLKTDINEVAYVAPALLSTDFVVVDGKKYSNWYSQSKGSSGLVVSYANTTWLAEGGKYAIVNYKSNVFGSQYGGNTYEDRLSNVSIPCSDVIKSTETSTWKDVTYGDTYINYFDVSTLLADLVQTSSDSYSVSAYVPLESSINLDLRHDKSSSHLTYNTDKAAIRQEYMGTHDYYDYTYEQELDLYLYNTVYSQQIDIKFAIPLDADKILETDFDCMIKASQKKTNGELSDSWATFGVNEYIEVDTSYGPINALKLFNDNLHFFQDKACGVVSVNERSLINDKSTAQLVLGTGGVLDRYQYISTQTGSKDKFSIVTSLTGLYWYDKLTKSIYKLSNGLMNLSKAKYIQSYLSTSLDNDFKVLAHTDVQNDEILFTFFKESETNGFTISYNEPVDSFVSFYDFIPTLYIPYQHRYLTTTNAYYCGSDFNRNRIYLHDSDAWDRCYFYALATGVSTKYVNSTIEILFNPDYNYTKVFDNLFYISNTSSKTTMTGPVKVLNIDSFSDTFHSVQCYNDFQNTGSVSLIHKTNIERRERGWTLYIPRNIVSTDISSNPNIFSAVSSTQLFKERMRDKYLISYFTYINDGTYDRFTVSNMGLKYRISYR